MTHDDGVRWLAQQLREMVEPREERARQGYLEATSGSEEEYWRGKRDAFDEVLAALHGLSPRP